MKKVLSLVLSFVMVFIISSLSLIPSATPAKVVDADVNSDGQITSIDMVEMRKILLNVSTVDFFDVNGDSNCNIIDCVKLKKIFAENYGTDNFYADNWSF